MQSSPAPVATGAPPAVSLFSSNPVYQMARRQLYDAGGAPITITGTGFTGATGVTIGDAPATAVTVVSNTQINASKSRYK